MIPDHRETLWERYLGSDCYANLRDRKYPQNVNAFTLISRWPATVRFILMETRQNDKIIFFSFFSHSSPESKESEAGIFGFISAFLPRATQECRVENHEQRNVLSRSTSGNPRKEFHDFLQCQHMAEKENCWMKYLRPSEKILGKILFHILNTHFSLVGSGSAENNNQRENSAKTKKPIFQILNPYLLLSIWSSFSPVQLPAGEMWRTWKVKWNWRICSLMCAVHFLADFPHMVEAASLSSFCVCDMM